MCYWLLLFFHWNKFGYEIRETRRVSRFNSQLFALVGLFFGRFIQKFGRKRKSFEENDPLKFDLQTPYRKKFLLKTIIWSFLPWPEQWFPLSKDELNFPRGVIAGFNQQWIKQSKETFHSQEQKSYHASFFAESATRKWDCEVWLIITLLLTSPKYMAICEIFAIRDENCGKNSLPFLEVGSRRKIRV